MGIRKYVDIKLIKILAVFYTLVESLIFIRWYFFLTQEEVDFYKAKGLTLTTILINTYLLDWVLVMLFMVMVSVFTKKMFEFDNIKIVALIHFVLSFVLSWFIYIFSSLTLLVVRRISMENALDNISFDHFIKNIVENFLIYFSMLGIIYIYYYIGKVKKVEEQKSVLNNQLSLAKMNSLKAQLHPHFLFNTLNSVSALIDINKKKAQDTLADLGDLLRRFIELKRDNLVPLEQELSLLQKYLDIKSLRFSDHLVINKDIEKGLENTLIPNLLLQPIFENSFKYGYSYDSTELKIDFSIKKKNDQLVIIIKNDGKELDKPFEEVLKKGTGIKNLISRLRTIYGDDFKFKMENQKNEKGITTEITIPYQEASSELLNF